MVEALGGYTRRIPGNLAIPFTLAAMPARYALERGDRTAAASLAPPASESPYTTALAHFARALGAARAGHPAAAGDDVAALSRVAEELAPRDPY